MNAIFQNNYLHISYQPDLSLMRVSYFPATAQMTEEEWKECSMEVLGRIKELRPRFLLSDNQQMFFVITIELQTWFARTILYFTQQGFFNVEKFALVMPEEFIAELAVEQTIEETKTMKTSFALQQKLFINVNEAEKWLLG